MPKPTKILLARRKSELPAPCTAHFAQVVLFVTFYARKECALSNTGSEAMIGARQGGPRTNTERLWQTQGRAPEEMGEAGRVGGAGGRPRNPYGRSASGLRRRRVREGDSLGTGKGARDHTTSCEGGGGRRGQPRERDRTSTRFVPSARWLQLEWCGPSCILGCTLI